MRTFTCRSTFLYVPNTAVRIFSPKTEGTKI
jgi:hypothetical protein